MDKNEAGSNLRTYRSLEQLIKDAYGLNAEQMRKRMEWAEQEAKSDAPLGGIPIPEAPENEFRTILAKMAARGITPKVMADFDEEKQKAFQDGSILESETLPHEEHGEAYKGNGKLKVIEAFRSAKEFLQKPLRTAGVVAACLAIGVGIFMAPRIDAMARKNYKYEARVRDGNTGRIVWNNQDKYNMESSSLEKAYMKIQEELDISLLKLSYIPQGMQLSELEIKDGYVKMNFEYKGNYIRILEVVYSRDSSIVHFSDCQDYMTITNEWIGQEIPIQKNKLSNGNFEYFAHIEIDNSYYTFEGIIEEKEFLNIMENVVLE
ncbi:MAG: DUF4367 domain-containing protein [Lachnospiraceae bacterium]|nr:DUF4367 domain-containing protein [Lachnospiraceae bacterium]